MGRTQRKSASVKQQTKGKKSYAKSSRNSQPSLPRRKGNRNNARSTSSRARDEITPVLSESDSQPYATDSELRDEDAGTDNNKQDVGDDELDEGSAESDAWSEEEEEEGEEEDYGSDEGHGASNRQDRPSRSAIEKLRALLEEKERELQEKDQALEETQHRLQDILSVPAHLPEQLIRPAISGDGWKRAPIKLALGLGPANNADLTAARTTVYNWLQACARLAVLKGHTVKDEVKRIDWGKTTWVDLSPDQRGYLLLQFRILIKSYEMLREVFYYPEKGPVGRYSKFTEDWPMIIMLQVVLRNEKEQEERPTEYYDKIAKYYLANDPEGKAPFFDHNQTIVRADGQRVTEGHQQQINRTYTHSDPNREP